MTRFEIGSTYAMRSAGDHNCIWAYTVTARTAKTVTITDGAKAQKCRVSEHNGTETVYPLGKFSKAPVLSAERRC